MKVMTTDARLYATARLSENIVETPEGFLLCVGVPIARTGELEYLDGELVNEDGSAAIESANGKVIVNRGPEDLFDEHTMASFEGKAVTIGHPADFVSPDNWRVVAVGTTQNVRQGEGEDEDKLIADLLITDSIAIQMVRPTGGQTPLREVSLGYEADYEQLGPGRGRQLNIVGNHVALVRRGRNGSEVAVRDHMPATNPGRKQMSKPTTAKKPGGLKERFLNAIGKGKTVDEAFAEIDVNDENHDNPTMDEGAKAMDERLAKIEDMIGQIIKDRSPEGDDPKPDVVSSDVDGEFEARFAAIEKALAKLLGMDEVESVVVSDEDPSKTKAKDAKPSTVIIKDPAVVAAAEILAPGTKNTGTLVKDSLEAFRKNETGSKVLQTLDSIKDETALLLAAAEVVKASRNDQLARTIDNFPSLKAAGPVTAEQINEANAKRWNR